jgi:hypothetical protein
VRTTQSIRGFSLFGSFGDKYREDITVNYQDDKTTLNIETGDKNSIFI